MKLKKQKVAKKFSNAKLKHEILHEARVLNLRMGAVEPIIEKTLEQVESWVNKRSEITTEDLTRVTVKALKKFDEDLAYAYQNRDKII